MNKETLYKLNKWHEEDEFQKIVDEISLMVEEEMDYDVISHLVRAFNNLKKPLKNFFRLKKKERMIFTGILNWVTLIITWKDLTKLKMSLRQLGNWIKTMRIQCASLVFVRKSFKKRPV